jgi:hypothetical protein
MLFVWVLFCQSRCLRYNRSYRIFCEMVVLRCGSAPFVLETTGHETLSTLMHRIQQITGICEADQSLVYSCRPLLDTSRTLCDYGISNGGVIDVHMKLRGGAAQCLPPNMMQMFAPRPPLTFWKPPQQKKLPSYSGDCLTAQVTLTTQFLTHTCLYRCLKFPRCHPS